MLFYVLSLKFGGQIGSGGNQDPAARGTGVDSPLDGGGIVGNSVAPGAKVPDIKASRFRFGGERQGVLPHGHEILRFRLQFEQGKDVGAPWVLKR